MLDVRKLRLLQEFSVRETIAETAAALGCSASAVSQQLTALEQETGTLLLRKRGRALVLTPQGRILVEHTERILHELDLAQTALDQTGQAATGIVRLAIFQTAATALLPEALGRLAQENPELTVQVLQREPEAALSHSHTREVDLVVAEQYPHHAVRQFPELDSRPLTRDPVRLAVPAAAQISSIREAADWPWVMETRRNASRSWAEHVCRSAGFEPEVRYEFGDVRMHRDLVSAGRAVALLPGFALAGCTPSTEGITLIDLPGCPTRHIFTSARRDMAPRPGIEAVRHALEQSACTLTD